MAQSEPDQQVTAPQVKVFMDGQVTNIDEKQLRALSVDSRLLREVYRLAIKSDRARERWTPDIELLVENDMRHRGDVSIQILKEMFMNPPQPESSRHIIEWVSKRPWLHPESFLLLARDCYAANRAKPMTSSDSLFDGRAMVEFLADWGEPEDKMILVDHTLRQKRDPWIQDDLMRRFRERQEFRARGTPDALPSWMVGEGVVDAPSQTAMTGVFEAVSRRKPDGARHASPPISFKVVAAVENRDGGPPWLLLLFSLAVLLGLLAGAYRLAR